VIATTFGSTVPKTLTTEDLIVGPDSLISATVLSTVQPLCRDGMASASDIGDAPRSRLSK